MRSRWRYLASIVSFALLGCGGPKHEMRPPREPVLATRANAYDPTPAERDRQLVRSASAPPAGKPLQRGYASWYGKNLAGRRTASGERFDPRLFTGAHKELPFGTWVEVRRLDNGRAVRVRINDRGPNGKAKRRVIDVSRRAAEDLDLVRVGVAPVEIRVVDGP